MRLELDQLGKIKNWIHTAQGVILFLAWVFTIAVFTRDGTTDGRTAWYFGLCWLTIPILIYLTMVPMWSRARKFSNVYAFACLDGFSIVLWLSAWAAVAAYVASGKGKGTNDKASGCDNFLHGSPAKCKLSEATVIFGVVIDLLFFATSYVSFRNLMHYKRTGTMPNYHLSDGADGRAPGGAGPLGGLKPTSTMHHDDDAFDSNMNARNDFDRDDEEHHDPRHGGASGYTYGKPSMDDEYAPVHQREHEDHYDDLSHARPTQPGGPLSSHSGSGVHTPNVDYDTSYSGAYGNRHGGGSPQDMESGHGTRPYGGLR